MLKPEQLKRITESVASLLESALDTLLEKAGKSHEFAVAQLLVNLSATYTHLSEASLLKFIADTELKSAVIHFYHCLRPQGAQDLTARQIVRPFVGQNEETIAMQQVVVNATIHFMMNESNKLDALSEKKDMGLLPMDFQRLLKNTSTEDADQKRKSQLSSANAFARVVPRVNVNHTEERRRQRRLAIFSPPALRPQEPEPEAYSGQVLSLPSLFHRLIAPVRSRSASGELSPQTYHVFLVGSRSDFFCERLRAAYRRFGDQLNFSVIPSGRGGNEMIETSQGLDALLVCEPGVDLAALVARRNYSNELIPSHKIFLISSTSRCGDRYNGFLVIKPPFDHTLIAELRPHGRPEAYAREIF